MTRATNSTAVLIGTPELCRRLEQQLDLLSPRPMCLGWIVAPASDDAIMGDSSIIGIIDDLEVLMARRKPSMALITLPAVMKDLITSIRTRLRKLGIADRFMPTLEDQIAGVGPRTHFEIDLTALLDRPPRQIDEAAVRRAIHNKCVLITGAGGSIGSELARIVARFEPSNLVLVERSENALFEIDRQIARSHPRLTRKALLHDVVDERLTHEHFKAVKPDVIFHAAAHKHVPMMEDHPSAAIDNNFFGTKSVMDAADAVEAERCVMITTDKAVNPTSIMGATKRLAELYVQGLNQRSGTVFSLVRFGNVLGSAGSVLETWARQIADGGPLTVTDPRMTRYFMSIPEAAALVIQSAAMSGAEDGQGGEVFLLDMGAPVRIVDLAQRFIEAHGLTPAVPSQSFNAEPTSAGIIEVSFTGIRPGEKLFEELSFDAEAMRTTEHPDINQWLLSPPDEAFIAEAVVMLTPLRRPNNGKITAEDVRKIVLDLCRPQNSHKLFPHKDLQQTAA